MPSATARATSIETTAPTSGEHTRSSTANGHHMPKKLPRSTTSAPAASAPSSRSQIESELAEITATIAYQDQLEKSAKKEKEKARAKFFKLADQILELDGLDRKVIQFPDYVGYEFAQGVVYRFTPAEYVARFYPGWQILTEGLAEDTQILSAVIEEIPSEQIYKYVNNKLGLIFGRQRSMVKGGIDLDWLREEHPGVFDAVTTWETVYSLDEEAAHLYLNAHPESQGIFERVCFDGTPQMKLASPTKLKDDE